jgi:hypothetical protein
VIKICPTCRRTFSGGKLCLHCQGVALLDVAEPAVRQAYLREGDLKMSIRTYYGARSAMLLQFWGILLGLAAGGVVLRRGLGSEGGSRPAAIALALGLAVGLPALMAFVGARLVHRFTRSCKGRPLQLKDVRIHRRPSEGLSVPAAGARPTSARDALERGRP